MRSNPDQPDWHGETRRQFIKKTGLAAAAVAGAGLLPLPVSGRENKSAVTIVLDGSDAVVTQPAVRWAAEQLRDALAARGVAARIFQSLNEAPPAAECASACSSSIRAASSLLCALSSALSTNTPVCSMR